MFKWLKRINEASDKWIIDRAYSKGLAGKGPWVLYRCQKCWGCFIEVDIIGQGKTGVCPKCGANRFEIAYPNIFENIKAVFRILRGK